MKLLNKLTLILTLSLLSSVAQARHLSTEDIYNYAKNRNYNALSRMTRYINAQDGNGNTALCLAVIDNDQKAYNILRQYGANPHPYCLQSAMAASSSSTFLGMGTTGWLTTGAIVAAGAGVAVAAGGGGGGGGSSSSKNSKDTSSDITDEDNGLPIIKKTIDNNDVIKIIEKDGGEYYIAVNNYDLEIITNSISTVTGLLTKYHNAANVCSIANNKNAKIFIEQRGSGNVYGIRSASDSTSDMSLTNAYAENIGMANSDIMIRNLGGGNVYGMFNNFDFSDIANAYSNGYQTASAFGNIRIENTGNNDVYGIKAIDVANNAFSDYNSVTHGVIVINNIGNGNVYGLSAISVVNNAVSEGEKYANVRGEINIENSGNGNVYGMKGKDIKNSKSYGGNVTGLLRISNNGSGKSYGLYGERYIYNAYTPNILSVSKGTINMLNKGQGIVHGIYSNVSGNEIYNNGTENDEHSVSIIEMVNKGNGLAVGIYSKDGTVENSGEIKIHNLGDGKAIGIYADGTTHVTNSGTITIDRASYTYDMATADTSDDVPYTASSSTTDMAIGIYGAADSTITNTSDGKIYINSASTAYGIYTEGNESSVTNNGTILINGQSNENAIHTNGGTLFQNGVLTATNNPQNSPMSVSSVKPASLNLNDFGGTVVASDTSQFIVEGAISGDLAINNSVVENGFANTYSVKDMIQAEDTSGLKLYSQSALFDAALQNNTDAVMTMKAFNDVVESSSVADFLQNNYAANNNEDLFKTLKSASSVAELNSNIDNLFGKNMFSRMAFEDLSMLREVSFDMNNHLFAKDGVFAIGENISPSSYDNSIGSVGRYSLNGYNNGKMSFGLGVSITDVRTDDGNNDNRRFDRNFMISAPIGYKTHGFEFITAPKMGYADGTYNRQGFDNKTYAGKIQKRMFALMNEARYPLKFGGMKLIPSAEFNMIGYNIKGHEDEKQYALRIKSQNHYSVEAGFGLMAEKEFKPYKDHKFNVSGGIAVYHEFANPYELEVGMSGMDGYYKLQDEKRSDNRAVVRFGFGYELKDNLDFSASWLTNIDREYRTDANIDLKYHF